MQNDQDGIQVAARVLVNATKWPPPSPRVDPTAEIVSIGRGQGCEATWLDQDETQIAARLLVDGIK